MRSVLALGSVACDAYVGARPQRRCSAVALVEDLSVLNQLAVNAGASMARSGPHSRRSRNASRPAGERYDLADSAAASVTMSRAEPPQAGVRARLPARATWEQLANTTPNDIRERNLFPKTFFSRSSPPRRRQYPERGSQVPIWQSSSNCSTSTASKLDLFGKLDPAKASPAEDAWPGNLLRHLH